MKCNHACEKRHRKAECRASGMDNHGEYCPALIDKIKAKTNEDVIYFLKNYESK